MNNIYSVLRRFLTIKLIDKVFGKKEKIVMYTSDTWDDCKEAKSFFAKNQIEVEYKNIAEKQNRDELKNKYNRLAVPTIIIGKSVILGFVENRDEIIELLKNKIEV